MQSIFYYILYVELLLQIDGERTLGENMADNGGLNHAYLAYQHYLRKYGPELQLPGFEKYSTSQLFFIAFGNVKKN